MFYFYTCIFPGFQNDIQQLPASLAGSLDLIPELLNVSRANATVKTYHLGFIRWKKWASINGISSVDILLVKPFFVAIYLSSLVHVVLLVQLHKLLTVYSGRII
jgi:hypothetical protein